MLDGGRQRVVHHFHAHVSAVVFRGQRHPLQNLQAAPGLADKNAGSVDLELGQHHAAQHVRFQALPILGAAVRHGEKRERARTIRGGIDLGDDRVVIGMVRIVDQPLLPLDVIIFRSRIVVRGRGARSHAEQVGAGVLFSPAQGEDFAFELGRQLVFFRGDQHHISQSAGGAGGHIAGVVAEMLGGFQHGAHQIELGIDIVEHVHHAGAQALVIENVAELRVFNGVHRGGVACLYLADFSRLHFLQSIWQFASTVLPPSVQGMMWSASMPAISNSSLQMAQMPACFL